jgi:DNA-binding transcriptional LysR family regulator
MLSFRVISQFIVLAEELHFGKAAERLHISQPPLSQAMMRLEALLGVTLINRDARRISLTDAGQVFLFEARRLVEQQALVIEHTRQAHRGLSGTVSLGFVGSVSYSLLPEMLAHLRRTDPQILFDLRELPSADQVRELQAKRVEIGVLRLPLAGLEGLDHKVIKRERMIAVLPRQHPLASRKSIELADLSGETFMMFPPERVLSLYAKTLMACDAAGFSPRTGLEAWQMPTMVSLIAAGVGVALLPAQVRSMPHEGVAYCEVTGDQSHLDLEIALAWRQDNRSALCHRVIDAVTPK